MNKPKRVYPDHNFIDKQGRSWDTPKSWVSRGFWIDSVQEAKTKLKLISLLPDSSVTYRTLYPGKGIPTTAAPLHVKEFLTLLPFNLLYDPRFTQIDVSTPFPIFVLSRNWEVFLALVNVVIKGKLEDATAKIWINGAELDLNEADGWLPVNPNDVAPMVIRMKELGKAPPKDWIRS